MSIKKCIKWCPRFNLRTMTGSAMAIIGTLHSTIWPILTPSTRGDYMWGWPAVVAVAGALLLAVGEFCNKEDF